MMEDFNKLLKSKEEGGFLNEYQKSAVINESKALLLNAGVGSGKTTVLVYKVLYLYHIKKVPLNSMVVLTFTNKAAEEIKTRILSSGSGIEKKDMPCFGTFHSVARYLLAKVLNVDDIGYTKDFSIMDENSSREIFEYIISSCNLNIKYRNKLEKRLEEYKNGREKYGNMKYDDEISQFVKLLQEEKKKRDLMDFDDLIENCARLLKKGDFKPSWVIIDEFQDTDSFQLDMVDGLVRDNTHVFAVGDPNQIIYTWRGSREDIFSIFKERYNAEEYTLPINYRSTGTILEAARAFLFNPSALEGIRDMGAPIVVKRHYNSFNEALYLSERIKKLRDEGVPYSEIALFYRKQKQSSVFEDVFKNQGIPYEVSVRKNIKDIEVLYWLSRLLKASVNKRDLESLIYVLCNKRYGMGVTRKKAQNLFEGTDAARDEDAFKLASRIRDFYSWCRDITEINGFSIRIYDYFDVDNYLSPTSITYGEDREYVIKYLRSLEEYILLNGYDPWEGIKNALEYSILYGNQVIDQIIHPEDESVKLMTLHASKGLEFRYVFISGANLGVIPIGSRFDDEEEKRLFFVGITRAKDYLEISYHSNPDEYNSLPNPSPYLRMIPDELIDSEEIKSRANKLSELRREIRNNMDKRQQEASGVRKRALHPKYGEGYVSAEDDDSITVIFEGYGEKSFAKMFCPLKILDE